MFVFICQISISEAKVPDLTPQMVQKKINEIMKAHATYKELNETIIERSLINFIEELDPNKTYFIESDIDQWIHPTPETLQTILTQFKKNNFEAYQQIYDKMAMAIMRHRELETQVNIKDLPSHVNYQEFKKLPWAKNDEELLTRLKDMKALQIEAAEKLNADAKEKSMQRIAKNQAKYEDEVLEKNQTKRENLLLVDILKALSSALDSHTAYFTPDEASQFMINVQQRLFGIGAQLRDDISGFTIVKIVDGGPAQKEKLLKLKDRIIAVNGEPVVGMDIVDAVELIRGEENTEVILTVVRETQDENGVKHEETLDIPIVRGEVVLKESRFESSYEPFGDGVIAYLRLHSFYQDPENSSASDLTEELNKIKEKNKVLGVILDLRNNSGGLLTQAVAVAGLFITKGIVVAIKNETGEIQYLRDIDGKTIWNGPLIVLINRASASASEIVAQTLQDYGRALIVGDDHSFGKGSFQTFTLNSSSGVNPEGEYKVTRGRYYTVSGKTPQLKGVQSDIVIPGLFSESELGEKFLKYPLESDSIPANYEDNLADIPPWQRDKIVSLYRFNLQKKLDTYGHYIPLLSKNSQERININLNYQNFLTEIKKKDKQIVEEEEPTEQFGQNDLQLNEAYHVMEDLLMLMQIEHEEAPAEVLAPAA